MPAHKNIAVIIGAGLLQVNLIKEAKKRYKVIVIDQNNKAPGARLADIFFLISTRDTSTIISSLKPFKKEIALCAVSGTDMTPTVAAVNEEFNLPGINKKQSLVLSNKGKMRHFCLKNNIDQPNFIVTKKKEEAYQWAKNSSHPHGFVIKPTQNMGARGVMLLRSVNDLSFAFEYAAFYSHEKEIILEEYLPADEYSVDALVFEGKSFVTGFADRVIEIKENRYFIETGHTMPSRAGKKIWDAVNICMQNFADSLSKLSKRPYHGALKADLRLYNNKIYIGEMAGRLSGGYMSTHTYPFASGNNLMSAYLDILENKVPSFIKKNKNNAYKKVCIERAIVSPVGRLEKFDMGPSIISKDENKLKKKFVHYKKKDLIFPLKNNIGKLANFIITSKTRDSAEKFWKNINKNIKYSVTLPIFENKAIRQEARKKFNKKFCKVCCVCNGINCASSVPGMGGLKDGSLFKKNIESFNRIKIIEKKPVKNIRKEKINLSCEMFGQTFSAPVFCAPITGAVTNLGGCIAEWDLGIEIAEGALLSNVLPFFGDGASEDKYHISLSVIEQTKAGLPVFKPRKNNNDIIKRIKEAEKINSLAWGIDIDAVKLKTLEIKHIETSKKNLADLKILAKSSSLPFVVKGISSKKEADMAADSGAYALVIGNHGGRVSNLLPDTVSLVEELAFYIRQKHPDIKILADGGVRSGGDIFKLLALGANAVLIGRPVAIAAVGLGRIGVHSLLQNYISQLTEAMKKTGVSDVQQINRDHIRLG